MIVKFTHGGRSKQIMLVNGSSPKRPFDPTSAIAGVAEIFIKNNVKVAERRCGRLQICSM